LTLQQPLLKNIGFLQQWLTRSDLGANFLAPEESAVWNEAKFRADLVSLQSTGYSGKFFIKATDKLVGVFSRVFGWRRWLGEDKIIHGLIDPKSSSLLLFIQFTTAILSSLLLMVSVVVLYFVHPTGARLGIIGGFTVVFSLCLVFFSGANRNEIFGATAA